MERRDRRHWTPGRSIFGGLARLGGALAWAAVAIIGAVIAVVVAAAMVAIALTASVLLALSGAALGARRAVRKAADPNLLEARQVGGHAWVAYAADAGR